MEWSILKYGSVNSTNEIAKELAHKNAAEGTVVVAEEQKSGHGRMGRSWHSPKGGLWFSLILRPKLHPSEAPEMMAICAQSVAEAVKEVCGLETSVKSPNDVVVKGKKLCGVLVEEAATFSSLQWMVIGIGVNANFRTLDLPEEVRSYATTILNEKQKPVDIELLLHAILANFEQRYRERFC